MDFYQVSWQGLRFYAYHGFFPEERILGNWYELNITISLLSLEEFQDNLEQTLDYSQVYQICQTIMKEPVDLLETLVEKMGSSIFHRWPHIKGIELSLSKINPPLGQSQGNSCIQWHKTFE
ncbi:dihydroneopterin aldolase [Aquirufa nivalisilvae]|uniref:dihydroneopterin aldolase n=1 Tax=Aquirufa nivalisilvae TaxID=2516557 RepID=UPI001032F039|nr:dihydroneopterin aldolase [Aquirufa nivalisilvae]TBH73953.1 dihydroneopterin aldolase [Aquirufa nivalisilvae]